MSQRDSQTDRLARRAAELLLEDATASTLQAIRTAAQQENLPPGTKLPTAKLVRDHLRALTQQTLGNEGYQQRVRRILALAEEIMTLFADAEPQLVGRTAARKIDGEVKIYLRLYTEQPIGQLADRLLSFGYADPKCTTANTKFGRFDRLTFEEEKIPIIITRCLPTERHRIETLNLYTRKPLTPLTLNNLRKQLNINNCPNP